MFAAHVFVSFQLSMNEANAISQIYSSWALQLFVDSSVQVKDYSQIRNNNCECVFVVWVSQGQVCPGHIIIRNERCFSQSTTFGKCGLHIWWTEQTKLVLLLLLFWTALPTVWLRNFMKFYWLRKFHWCAMSCDLRRKGFFLVGL